MPLRTPQMLLFAPLAVDRTRFLVVTTLLSGDEAASWAERGPWTRDSLRPDDARDRGLSDLNGSPLSVLRSLLGWRS